MPKPYLSFTNDQLISSDEQTTITIKTVGFNDQQQSELLSKLYRFCRTYDPDPDCLHCGQHKRKVVCPCNCPQCEARL